MRVAADVPGRFSFVIKALLPAFRFPGLHQDLAESDVRPQVARV